jgi:hypothetical protein
VPIVPLVHARQVHAVWLWVTVTPSLPSRRPTTHVQKYDFALTPASVLTLLQLDAAVGKISSTSGSPNLLLQVNGCRTSCDCDDGNFCTVDTCNAVTKKCAYTFNFACTYMTKKTGERLKSLLRPVGAAWLPASSALPTAHH